MKHSLLHDHGEKEWLSGGQSGGSHSWQTMEFLDFVLESAENLIAVVSLDGTRLYCNAAYRALLGDHALDYGGDILDDFYSDDRARAQQLLVDTVRTGVGRREQLRLVSHDGIVRLVEIVGRILPDSAGRPTSIALISRDVTERKEAEHRLRLLAYTATSTKDFVIIMDLEGHLLFANESFLKAHGYSEEEVLGRVVSDFVSPLTPREAQTPLGWKEVIEEWSGELVGLRKDGTNFPLEASASLMRDESGVPIALFGVARDITDRKRAEEALRRERDFSAAIVDTVGALVVVLDQSGRIVSFNRACEQSSGYRFEEVRGKHVWDLLIPPEEIETIKAVFKDLRSGRFPGQHDNCWVRKDGQLRLISWANTSLLGKDGGVEYVIATGIDITQRMIAEEALKTSELQYKDLFESVNDAIVVFEPVQEIILEVNHKACEMYGFTKEELVGKSLKEITKDVGRGEAVIRRILYDGGLRNFETTHFRKDGMPIEVLANASVVEYKGQRALLSINRDITERKRAEQVQTAIYRISQAVNTTHHLQELFEAIHAIVQDLITARNLYIALYDHGNDLISFPYFVDECDAWSPPKKPGRGLTEYVLRTGEPLLASQEVFDELVRLGEVELIGEPSVDWIGVPLKGKRGTFGVLAIQSYDERTRYTGEDKEILQFVSTQIALAIERKQGEEALRDREEQYRRIYNNTPVMLQSVDPSGVIVSVSDYWLRALGYDRSEVIGRPFDEFLTQQSSIVARVVAMPECARRGFCQDVPLQVVKRNGEIVEVLLSAIAERNDEQEIVGEIAVLIDVTERKKAEDERARLSSAIEQAGESVVITDPEATILYVNPAFERVTGYTKEEALGKKPSILSSGVHPPEFYRAMWGTLAEGKTWIGHLVNKRKDGSLFEEDVTISPVRDGTGATVNYVAVKRDVTPEKRMEQQLRQAQKMESLGQLAGGIAHDFNNVLGVILGTLSLLRTRIEDEKTLQYIEMGESSVQRGADVAKRLLTFARAEETHLVPLLMEDVIRELLRVLEHSFEKTIEIRTDVDRELPIVYGDHGQLYQMLLNLCVNARDAILDPRLGKKNGTITIRVREAEISELQQRFPIPPAGHYVRVSVSDDGMGMPNKVRQRVFEPFFTTKPAGKGTGLGLAVVYGVVKSHGGLIDVESEVGRGTTFVIYLPATVMQQKKKEEVQKEEVRGGKETILVVEDEEALRTLLTELLEVKGYKVVTAIDGVDGVEAYQAHGEEIDAVITDMGLPKMSGQDMFMKIIEVNPAAKVILASGYLDPHLKSRLFVSGAKAFIQKPYKAEEVLSTVREVLDLKP